MRRVFARANANGQLSTCRTLNWMRLLTIICLGPPSNAGVLKKPSETTKTSRPPAATPGRVSGSVTRQHVFAGCAPRLADAWRKPGGLGRGAVGEGESMHGDEP